MLLPAKILSKPSERPLRVFDSWSFNRWKYPLGALASSFMPLSLSDPSGNFTEGFCSGGTFFFDLRKNIFELIGGTGGFEIYRNNLGDAFLFHRNSKQGVCKFHAAFIVCDHDDL